MNPNLVSIEMTVLWCGSVMLLDPYRCPGGNDWDMNALFYPIQERICCNDWDTNALFYPIQERICCTKSKLIA